jgi:hypothetical protein
MDILIAGFFSTRHPLFATRDVEKKLGENLTGVVITPKELHD